MDTVTFMNNDDCVSIKIISVSVHIQPEVLFQDGKDDITQPKELSAEEKKRLFYKQRLEQISKPLTLASGKKLIIE